MSMTHRRSGTWGVVALVSVTCGVAAHATGAIIGTDASVSTIVQELIDGTAGSVNSDSEQLDAGSSNLPLVASGGLTSTDLDGVLVATAHGLSEFADPTRLDEPNPEEFALEVGCFSHADAVAYSVNSVAEEARTVVFTTPGSSLAPSEITFGLDGTRAVESRIFLSGAVIFWSTEPGLDLSDMLSEFHVTVTRDDTGASLFDTTLTISGSGTDDVQPAATGPIRFEVIGLDDLAEEGVDDGTLAILESVERTGTLIVVVIPEQEHVYTYTVRANQPFVLRAEFSALVRNAPGGTGVAAVLGRPFENLADFIDEGLPGVNGTALQRSVNSATAARVIGLVPAAAPPTSRSAKGLCGTFGLESAALLIPALFLTFGRRRRGGDGTPDSRPRRRGTI